MPSDGWIEVTDRSPPRVLGWLEDGELTSALGWLKRGGTDRRKEQLSESTQLGPSIDSGSFLLSLMRCQGSQQWLGRRVPLVGANS